MRILSGDGEVRSAPARGGARLRISGLPPKRNERGRRLNLSMGVGKDVEQKAYRAYIGGKEMGGSVGGMRLSFCSKS